MELDERPHLLHGGVREAELAEPLLRHPCADDLVVMERHAVGDARVEGFPMSWRRPARPERRIGLEPFDDRERVASTSLCRWTGSCSSWSAGSSGRNSSASPESTNIVNPAPADRRSGACRARRGCRSALTMRRRSRIVEIASIRAEPDVTPSWETNRAARSMRMGSSERRDLGSRGCRAASPRGPSRPRRGRRTPRLAAGRPSR